MSHNTQIFRKHENIGAVLEATVPLELLFPFLTLAQACKIALAHGINAGSQCNIKLLLARIESHSCLICNLSFSISHIDKSTNQLAAIRNQRMWNKNKNKNEKKKSKTSTTTTEQLNGQKNTNNNVTNTTSSEQLNNHKNPNNNQTNTRTPEQLNNQKNIDNNISSFPPSMPDKNLYHQIISDAVKKMDPKNIEEAGCALCGLLKPSYELSHLKNVKNPLHILQKEGVTHVEW